MHKMVFRNKAIYISPLVYKASVLVDLFKKIDWSLSTISS